MCMYVDLFGGFCPEEFQTDTPNTFLEKKEKQIENGVFVPEIYNEIHTAIEELYRFYFFRYVASYRSATTDTLLIFSYLFSE